MKARRTQRRSEAQCEEMQIAPSRLAASGLNRPSNPLVQRPAELPVPEGEEPGSLADLELPSDWREARLGDLFEIQQGKAVNQRTRGGDNQQPFLRTANVFWGRLNLAPLDHMHFAPEEQEGLLLKPGDLLTCEGGDVGRTAIWRGELHECFHQNHVHRLRTQRSDVEPEFYMRWMEAAVTLLGLYAGAHNKTTIPNLSKNRLARFAIPHPPLPEQRAIAGVLRTVQQAKEACEQVLAATRQLKQSLLHHLFTYGPVPFPQAAHVALKETEIGPLPEHWSVVSIGDIETFMQYGTSSRCESGGAGLPVLRIPNVLGGRIDTADLKYLAASPAEIERHSLQRGDLLFVRTNGVRENVGRCAVYLGSPEPSLFASYLIRARLASDRALPEFVQLFTETNAGRASFTGRASGAADGKFNINTQTIRSTILPLPPLSEQREIAAQLSAVDAKLAAEESRRSALAAIFQSLLHHLLTGKVRLPEFVRA